MHKLIVLCLFVTLGCFGCAGSIPPHGQSSRCVLIYSEASYWVHWEGSGPWWQGFPHRSNDWDDKRDFRTGTAFAIRVDERRFIVTAAHVVARTWPEGQAVAQASAGNLRGGTVRVRVSSLAYPPVRLMVAPVNDLVVMEMPPAFWEQLDLMVFRATPDLPRPGDEMCVWGFPGTAAPQLAQDGIKVTMATAEMIVLNKPLEGGFSGGPILTGRDGTLKGMTVRSTDRQSRVVPIGKILGEIKDFDAKAITYTDSIELKP